MSFLHFQLCFNVQQLGDIMHQDQPGDMALPVNGMRIDLDLNDRSVLPAMPRGECPLFFVGLRPDVRKERGNVFKRPYVLDAHGQELLP